MSTNVRPLLARLPLLPGESLISLLVRLAQVNDYDPQSIILKIIHENGKLQEWTRLGAGTPEHFFLLEKITALTKIEPDVLYKATAHRFTHLFTPPEEEIQYFEFPTGISVPLLPRGLADNHLRSERKGQFCPSCLEDFPYHRLIWLPIASSACLQHKCLLINSCPQCGKPVKASDISTACCSKCKADLREAQVVSVENDPIGLSTQQVIQSWLMEKRSPVSVGSPQLSQSPRVLYRVIEGLNFSIVQVNPSWPLLHHRDVEESLFPLPTRKMQHLTPSQSYCLHATAFKGITDWPNGFYLFLTAYQNREMGENDESDNKVRGIHNTLGNLYTNWIYKRWRCSELEFVQKAFDQYLIDNHILFPSTIRLNRYKDTPEIAANVSFIDTTEAAVLLNTGCNRIRSLIKSGYLTLHESNGKIQATLLKRDDILALRDKWNQTAKLEDVTALLGLSKALVLKLVQMRVFNAQPRGKEGFYWMFSILEINDFLSGIMQSVTVLPVEIIEKDEDLISLRRTSFLSSRVGLDTASILLQIAEGKLHAYLPRDQKLQLKNLLLRRTDIDKHVESVRSEKGWMRTSEVLKMLNIDRRTLSKLVEVGLIAPVARKHKAHFFDKACIEKFAFDYVGGPEGAKILGVSRQMVSYLVRQGRIRAISGPRIDGGRYYVLKRESVLEYRRKQKTQSKTQTEMNMTNMAN